MAASMGGIGMGGEGSGGGEMRDVACALGCELDGSTGSKMSSGVVYALGFSLRKRALVRCCFAGERVVFVRTVRQVPPGEVLAVWGRPAALPGLAAGVRLVCVEDGFLRSVGLGADLVRPLSWVVDKRGIYFDATRPSDLEAILQTTQWTPTLLQRAAALREGIVRLGLTKYNVGHGAWQRPAGVGRVILVPGQVEADASLRFGSPQVRGNLELLRRVRQANPQAYVVYKPHPDVVAGLRLRGQQESRAAEFCDAVLTDAPIHQLLEQVDEVHVMTSLAGFEALLRGRKVTCYGLPFYAGWGLTHDVLPAPRRGRVLTLDELVAGALILYPRYFHPDDGCETTPEQTLAVLQAWREQAGQTLPWRRRLLRPALHVLAWWRDSQRSSQRDRPPAP